MSQAIKLPIQIAHELVTQQIPLVGDIQTYAREVAIVGIILSDNYMKQLYEASQQGYIFCIDLLQEWAVEFVEKFAEVEEWEEFIGSDKNPYPKAMCWDDVVIMFGLDKYNDFIK